MPIITPKIDLDKCATLGRDRLQGGGSGTLLVPFEFDGRSWYARLFPAQDEVMSNEDGNVLLEVHALSLLEEYFWEFLPRHMVIEARFSGQITEFREKFMHCVATEKVNEGEYGGAFHTARNHLKTLKNDEDKRKFLENLHLFIQRCKLCFRQTGYVVDMASIGNVLYKWYGRFLG